MLSEPLNTEAGLRTSMRDGRGYTEPEPEAAFTASAISGDSNSTNYSSCNSPGSPAAVPAAAHQFGYRAPNPADRLFMRWLNAGSYLLSCSAMLLAAVGFRHPGENLSTLYSEHSNVLTPAVWNLWIWAVLHVLGGLFALYQGCATAVPGSKLRTLFVRLDPGFAIANLGTAAWALTVLWSQADIAVWFGAVSLLLLTTALIWSYFRTQVWQVTRTAWFELLVVDTYLSGYTAWALTTLLHQLAAAVTAVELTVSVPAACVALGLLATVSLLASRRADPAFGFFASWGFAGVASRRVSEGECAAMVQAVGWTLGGLVLLLSLWTAGRLGYTQFQPFHSKRSGPTYVSDRKIRPYSREAYAVLQAEHETLRKEYNTVCERLRQLGAENINLIDAPAGQKGPIRLLEMNHESSSKQAPLAM
eukprot:SAG31_NODE_6330_length_2063_cov_1.400713_2_plen_419_part_00